MYIAIAGNIGAGKTTLTTKLAKHYKWEANYEDVENNPYLNDFYRDMQRWSFNLQVFFLNSRFRQIINIRESKKTYIQDRTGLLYVLDLQQRLATLPLDHNLGVHHYLDNT